MQTRWGQLDGWICLYHVSVASFGELSDELSVCGTLRCCMKSYHIIIHGYWVPSDSRWASHTHLSLCCIWLTVL